MSFRFVPAQRVIENSQNIAKIFKKLKNPVMASFQAKIVWKRLKKREIKIIVSFRSYSTDNREFQKNSKIIQKIQKYHYGFISSENRLEKVEKERK